MSTENRNKVLLGFGALVAVVIVAIALWPANFRKEDASGAVGAAQKHRAPQITQKDVILGDETVRHQQKVLYADFLADAAKLRTMAASKNYDVAAEFANELRTRYVAEAEVALAEAELAVRASGVRGNQEVEIAEMRSTLKVRGNQPSDADMQQFNVRMAHFAEANAKSMVRTFADADSELALAVKRLEVAKLESENLAVAKQLKDVETLLSRPVVSVSLAEEGEYLTAIQREVRTLEVKPLADQEYADRISLAAEELEAKAMKNIKASAELTSEMAGKLSAMDDAIERASHFVSTRGGIEASSIEILGKNIAAAKGALLGRENEFYARANAATGEELAAVKMLQKSELQSQLMNLQTQLRARQQPY